MSDSRTPQEPLENDDRERPPRYEQVIRWAEYINEQPPVVWGPQQNAVVNAGIESAQAVEVSAADRKRIRAFAKAEVSRSDGGDGE